MANHPSIELRAKSNWIAQAREDYHIFRTTLALLDATEEKLAWAEATLEPSVMAAASTQIDEARQRYRDYLRILDRGSAKLASFLSSAPSRSVDQSFERLRARLQNKAAA